MESTSTTPPPAARQEGQIPRALNHTRSQDAGEEYKLPVIDSSETRKVSCMLDIGSDLTIARPEL